MNIGFPESLAPEDVSAMVCAAETAFPGKQQT